MSTENRQLRATGKLSDFTKLQQLKRPTSFFKATFLPLYSPMYFLPLDLFFVSSTCFPFDFMPGGERALFSFFSMISQCYHSSQPIVLSFFLPEGLQTMNGLAETFLVLAFRVHIYLISRLSILSQFSQFSLHVGLHLWYGDP